MSDAETTPHQFDPDDQATAAGPPKSGSAAMGSRGTGVAAITGEPLPEKVGPYKVIRQLGRGGMGAVYLCVRADDSFKRRVAVKVIRRGMDSEDILGRFELERQVLAGLNHPHIARLFEGGITDDGRPYFVMEYIEGQPIDKYCDAHRLSVTERLQLFRNVCIAVHYAHQNLVVHRDLKPANILITKDGSPKLVDFGIAKLLNPDLSPGGIDPTATELRLMTPEYASPEQVRGEPISTSSDVYSLGVLLYELLTGHRPYRLRTRLQAEIERIICEQEPERPSTVVGEVEQVEVPPTKRDSSGPSGTGGTGATSRTITPESVSRVREGRPDRLRKRLMGDIDNIVFMAMRKEPQRRYASAEQFAEDIRRHLMGMPVTAAPDTFGYRINKFVRRHRVGVGVAALFVLTLTLGIVGTTWQATVATRQRDLAEARFERVRSLARTFMFDFHDSVQRLAGSTPAREMLVTTARDYLDSLAGEVGGHTGLMKELGLSYKRVGDIQGGLRGGNLGDITGATASYERALEVLNEVKRLDPDDPDVDSHIATVNMAIGDVKRTAGDLPGALELYEAALEEMERRARENPNDADNTRALAISLVMVGDVLKRTGDTERALRNYRRSLQIREGALRSTPDDRDLQREVSVGLLRVGDLLQRQGELEDALVHLTRLEQMRRAISEAEPTSGRALRDHSLALYYLAGAQLDAGRHEDALANAQESLTLAERLAGADPDDARAALTVLLPLERLGDARARAGDVEGAVEAYDRQLRLADQAVARSPADTRVVRFLARACLKIGDMRLAADEAFDALRQYQRYLSLTSEAWGASNADLNARREMGLANERVGRAMAARGDRDGALASFESAIAIFDEIRMADLQRVDVIHDLERARTRVRHARDGSLTEAADIASALTVADTSGPEEGEG